MTGTAIVLQGNALALPLPDESVDLIVTSPPYFALRSYQDGGEHYAGQIGSEPTPKDFVDALVTAMREAVRVLKPTGSIFVNLGDKYAGSGGHNNATLQAPRTGEFGTRRREKAKATRRTAPDHYNKSREVAEGVNVARKSLLGLPWRFALACTDELGLILREEIVWSKPNGLPESVRDRCRRTHEQWFHFVKEPRYFSGIDEIRSGGVEAVTQCGPFCKLCGSPSDSHAVAIERGEKLDGSVEAFDLPHEVTAEQGVQSQRTVGANGKDGLGLIGSVVPLHVEGDALSGEHFAHAVQNGEAAAVDHHAQDGGAAAPGGHEADGSFPVDNPGQPCTADCLCGCHTPTVTSLGKLPPSVWTIATEPLTLPALAIEDDRGWRMFGRAARTENDARKVRAELWAYAQRRHAEGCESLHVFEPDHFAAFPTEWPRRLILGFAPSGVCTVCGEGRVPAVVADPGTRERQTPPYGAGRHGKDGSTLGHRGPSATVVGYVCSCTPFTDHPGEGSNSRERDRGGRREYHLEGWDPPPTTPAVVLDPFGGTGTVAMVAKALGHVGISVDLSLDYTRLARWRCEESGHGAKAIARTAIERQGVLL